MKIPLEVGYSGASLCKQTGTWSNMDSLVFICMISILVLVIDVLHKDDALCLILFRLHVNRTYSLF